MTQGGRFSSDPQEVSARMRRIRSKGTIPERKLFAILDQAGVTYRPYMRVHGVTVDAVIEDQVAFFVDSPFWHLRDVKELRRLSPYWKNRLLNNRRRDRRQNKLLRSAAYVVIRVWSDELDDTLALIRIRRAIQRVVRRRSRSHAELSATTSPESQRSNP